MSVNPGIGNGNPSADSRPETVFPAGGHTHHSTSQQTPSQIRQAFYDLAQRANPAPGHTVIDLSNTNVRDFLFTNVSSGHQHDHSHSHNFQQRPARGQAHTGAGRDENQNGGPAPSQDHPDWRVLLKWFERAGPFFILIFIKLMYDHRLGILLFAGLMGTFYYANRKLELEIYNSVLRDNRTGQSRLTILWIICLMVVNILAIYYVFSDQELYRSLYFQLPVVETVDFWTMGWVIVITDFILKFISISLKGCISLLPKSCLSSTKRGKYYMFLEEIIQTYRCLVNVRPWLHYLADTKHGGQTLSMVLLLAYVICKGNLLYKKLKELKEAFHKVRVDMVFGTRPTKEEIKETNETCPICQDDYNDPVKLTCKHIFCEDCVSIWFDREKTCPMCRAQIADNPMWRDGSTLSHVQWF